MKPIAHSAKPEYDIPPQSYEVHIAAVVDHASKNIIQVAKYYSGDGQLLIGAVRLAAEFHDIGKLDKYNQDVLVNQEGKMLNHVDAGTAVLLSEPYHNAVASLLIYSHHHGLPSLPIEKTKGNCMLRDDRSITINGNDICMYKYTDENIKKYLDKHRAQNIIRNDQSHLNLNNDHQVLLRMALSCLVDADHYDTAKNYNSAIPASGQPLLSEKRLKLLDKYVMSLAKDYNERNHLRQIVYQNCKEADPCSDIVACDSPVGTGKTTAVMANLLNIAKKKGLRRVFVVLPFTNIIDQSVKRYQEALIDDTENPEDIVVAHHHKVEFHNEAMRQYSFLWNAPIIVTTAVQFFETLAGCSTASIRKLHNIAGSAIFIDEAHAALPFHLWPQAWLWVKQLAQDWGCYFVLGSGSLSRFWEMEEFEQNSVDIPDLINRKMLPEIYEFENTRVEYKRTPEKMRLGELLDFVLSKPKPAMLIVNTVQSAAVIANEICEKYGEKKIEHLSTSLCPLDREVTLNRIRERLKNKKDDDWVLVATSCVEAGVDISFRTGFRERASFTSFIQTAGRINREGIYSDSILWDIVLEHDEYLLKHPGFEDSAKVLGQMFDENKIDASFTTEALRREIRSNPFIEKIQKAERNFEFPEVEKLFKVINTDTRTVVVKEDIVEKLKSHTKVSSHEIMLSSVQIWNYKILRDNKYGVEEIRGFPELFRWTRDYDEFLGYMKGIVNLLDFYQKGGGIV